MQTRNDVTFYVDEAGQTRSFPTALINAIAGAIAQAVRPVEVDTQGDTVPTNKAHAYTYDGSGNLSTDTVTDGASTWIRTYTYTPTGPATDSGWVKQ